MLFKVDDHTDYIGKICKLSPLASILEIEYEQLFGFGNPQTVERLYWWCADTGQYSVSLMFIDQPPIKMYSKTWYCVKEIGKGVTGDWHWFTLDQLIVCN